MSKPRIALVTSYFPSREEPYRGQSAYQTVRHMTAQADICAFVPNVVYPDWFKPTKSRYEKTRDMLYRPPGVAARYFQYWTVPIAGRALNGELVHGAVEAAVNEFRPNLILNYWVYPDGYAAVKLGRELKVPVIVSTLGSDVRRIEDPVTRWLTSRTLRRADYVIAVSRELAERAIGLGARPDRTRAILNGFDETVFHPGGRAAERARLEVGLDDEIVFYAGSLIPSKGLNELLDAVLALRARRPRLRLVCAGAGPMKDEMARRAGQGLLLPGKLSGAEVRSWMVAANLFCLPSYSEGCPNVIVEALACGRAVVATDVGGIPELVNELNGILVAARDARALERGLDEALNRSWNDEAVAATYRRSWRTVAEETWAVCQEALGHAARPAA